MIDPRGIMSLIPMLRFSVALILGIFLGDTLLDYIKPIEWFCAAVVSCILGVCVIHKKILSSFLVFLTIFYLGASYISYKESMSTVYTNRHLICEGVIISEPIRKGKVIQCDMLIIKGWQSHTSKVRASIRLDNLLSSTSLDNHVRDSIKVGTTLQWVSTVQKPHRWTGHDDRNFSYIRWMHVHDYEANVFLAKGKWHITDVDLSSLSMWQKLKLKFLVARSNIIHQISSLDIDDESFSVIVAMTLGDKSLLTKDQKNMFSVAGAAHILALSGMHIGIIMFLLTVIVGGRKKIKLQLLAILSVWLFVIFIGLSVSAVRAVLMMTLWYVLHVLRRSQHPLNVLGLVAFILIAINPEIVFDAGFQMSFMAVFFIFLCMPYLQEHRPFRPKLKKKGKPQVSRLQRIWIWLYSMVCISCVAQLGTLPLTIYYFGRIPVYFLLTNLIVLPLAVLVIYVTIVLVFSVLIGFYANDIANILDLIMSVMNSSIKYISCLPGASIENIDINTLQVVALYVIIFCLLGLVTRLEFRSPRQWNIYIRE